MAVTRSPFVKKQTIDYGYGVDEDGNTTYTDTLGVTTIVGKGKDKAKDQKSTLQQEQSKLGRVINKATSLSRMLPFSPARQDDIVESLKNLKNTGKNPKDIGMGALGLAGSTIGYAVGEAPMKALEKLNEAVKPIRAPILSGITELGEGLAILTNTDGDGTYQFGPYKGQKVKASWSDFVKQAKNKEYNPWGEGGPYYRDSKLGSGLKFFGDVVADPTTYVTLPASYAGKANKIAMATRMAQLTPKYPELLPLLDNIARYGPVEIPKHIREAENIFVGVQYLGFNIPNSVAAAKAWRHTMGAGSQKVGDFLYRNAPSVLEKTAKKSIKPLVSKGISRGLVTGEEWMDKYLGGLGEWSASAHGRGAGNNFAAKEFGKIQTFLREVDALSDAQRDNLYKVIENRSGAYAGDEVVEKLAADFRTWDDNAYKSVADVRQVFGDKWDVSVGKLGYIEDHLFHTMTDDARKWMRKDGAKSGWFDDLTMSPEDLESGRGISSYRRLRGLVTNPDGSVTADTFMGERVVLGSIEEINAISQRQIGVDWFKTDVRSIAESSIRSYGNMVARVKYYDRMMEFGPQVAKPLIRYVVPDEELVTSLTKATELLAVTEKKLLGRISRGVGKLAASREGVATELQTASDLAINVLAGKTSRRIAVDDEIELLLREVDTVIEQLRVAGELATTKTADGRGEFNDMWSGLIREAEQYRAALAGGTSERFITLKELRKEYITLYPDATNLDGKSAEWFAERIVRAAGGADAIDAKEAARVQTREFLLQQRDLLPPDADEEIRFINQQLMDNDLELEAIRRLNDVKIGASYAEDGLIYGFPPDVTGEPIPFQLFTTKPIDNEFGTFAQMPDAIAGHAFPDSELLDLRDPETFLNFLNPEFWADDLNKAWNEVGINSYIDEADVAKMIENNGALDPNFIRVYPEKSELLMGLYDMAMRVKNTFDAGDMPRLNNGELGQFFNWFTDMQRRIAYSISPDNSDVVGSTVTQWWFKNLVDSAEEYGFRGALVPAINIFGDNFDVIDDAWAVLMPSNTKPFPVGESITDPWQMVAGNTFIKNALDNVMENAQLSALDKTATLRAAGINIELNVAEKARLDKLIAEQSEQSNAFKSLVEMRNADNLMVNGVATPRTTVVQNLAKIDEFFEKSYNNIDREVRQEIEKQFGVEELQETQRLLYEERLPMLMDEAQVLKSWTDGTAAGLTQEIMDMVLLLKNKPAKGSTGVSNEAWVNQVEKTMRTSLLIDDPAVRAAYDRVTTLLHADEVALSKVSEEIAQNISWLSMAKMGLVGGKIMTETAEKGWKEIENLGIQMPREVLDVWGPNIKKLTDQKEYNKYLNALDAVNSYWKSYVTASVGFFVRNGMSGTFMNYADGVSNNAIITGARWAAAQMETKLKINRGKNFSNWIDQVGLTDPADIAKAEWATQVVMATGHGVSDDFAVPVTATARYVTDNKYLRFFSRKNMAVERALRLPMAIDSFEKGLTFDEAVARINRIHFDYSDLSKLDASAKRVVPFWIWTSRNVPLQLTQIATRPKAYYEYEKLKKEFPVNPDLIMPKWIQDRDPLGIASDWVLTPDLPQVRLFQQLKSIATPMGLLGQTTPVLKTIAELGMNRQLGIDVGPFNAGGAPEVTGYNKPVAKFIEWALGNDYVYYDKQGNLVMDARVNHVIEQAFPPLAQLNRLTGGLTGGKDTLSERLASSWYNWFGVPARQIKETQERAEVIRRRYEAEDVKKDLQKELDKLKATGD